MSQNNTDSKVVRNFPLTTWALNNKNTVYLLAIVLIVFGSYTYRSMPKELFPDIVMPVIMVQTIYPGNPPIDIENLITRPIEKEVESVDGIDKISSMSSQDASNIFIEFNPDVEIKTALQDVKDAVDKASSELPDDLLSDPMITDIDFSEFPIMNINLSGDYSVNELKDYAEYLEDEIESISEISSVTITGVTEKEIKVDADPYLMESMKISFYDIAEAIRNENISISGGEFKVGDIRRSIRIIGEFQTTKQIGDIIVKHENGNIVYLRDIADVTYDFEDPVSFARLDNKPVVSVQVIKKGGENLISATEQIFDILKHATKVGALPEDLKISITNDQSEEVKLQLSNLENSMIMGIIFVILVLFFFLGTRNSLFVGIAIPFSMFMSFMIMGLMDFRVNMIVLFSLILALGMLVDNAIVVVENIYRFVDKGYKPLEAARQAVGEIAMPIISSTATTLAAFFPLLFWDSLIGNFMKYLPQTLIIVLSSSLFVALVLIPVISSSFIKTAKSENKPKTRRSLVIASVMAAVGILLILGDMAIMGNLLIIFAIIGLMNLLFLHRLSVWFQHVFLVWLEDWYLKILTFALRGRNALLFIVGTFLLLIATSIFYFGSNPKVVFFPDTDPKYINIMAEYPIGTDIEVTNISIEEIQNRIYQILEPNMNIVESVLTNVGKGAVGENEGFMGRGGGSNKALITVSFIDFKDRGAVNTSDIMRELSAGLLGEFPGVTLTVEKQAEGPPAGKPINIEIKGKDFNQLIDLSDEVIETIKKERIEGIEELQIDLDVGKPELIVDINRETARRFGLSTGQIANTVRTALFGEEVSDFKVGEDEYPIQLRLKENYRYDLATLMNQKVTFRDQSSGKIVQVPISAVADISYSATYGAVLRNDLKRVVTVWSNVIEGYNANEINMKLKDILSGMSFPEGYSYEFTGEQEEMADAMAFLEIAMVIAISLILLILVSQFNSVVKPVIILVSVLLSTIGVFGGLATFRMEFVVIMTGIGVVSLAGVVVNNAIVLIDYIGLLKKRKKKAAGLEMDQDLPYDVARQAIIEAGQTRLRPVLLTAITTILGLMPLAVGLNIDIVGFLDHYDPDIYFGGDNAAFWGPMSWTIIFGLSFATFLTLVIVPSMYHVFYSFRVYVRRKLTS